MNDNYGRLSFRVVGIPQPQGSTRAFVRNGRAIVTSDNAKLRPWRDSVTYAAIEAKLASDWATTANPVSVAAWLFLPRPTSHHNAKGLRPAAPTYPAKKPDIDKLIRSTLDSMTDAGIWVDDGQVVELKVSKCYANADELVGLDVTVRELRP